MPPARKSPGRRREVSVRLTAPPAGLDATLQGAAGNLLASIDQSHATQTADEVFGQDAIVPVAVPTGGFTASSLPYTASSTLFWSDVPDQFRTALRVQIATTAPPSSAVDRQLFADEIYGRRLELRSNYNASYLPFVGTLTLDEVSLGTVTSSLSNVLQGGTITLTANHPYAAARSGGLAGSYVDGSYSRTMPFAPDVQILTGWGDVGEGLLAAWSNERRTDSELPAVDLNRCTDEVAGEIACPEPHPSPSGDFTRARLGASWLAQTTRMAAIQARLASAADQHHRSMGFSYISGRNRAVYNDPANPPIGYNFTETRTAIDFDTAISLTSRVNDETRRRATLRSIATAASALEGSVLEQMQSLPDTASTATRFAWANRPSAWGNPAGVSYIEDVAGNIPRTFIDWSGVSGASVDSLLLIENTAAGQSQAAQWAGSYRTYADNLIEGFTGAGWSVTGSTEGWMGPGARYSPPNQHPTQVEPSLQRGAAVIATRFGNDGDVLEIAHAVDSFGLSLKGGGGWSASNGEAYDASRAAEALRSRFQDRSSALGVDLRTGQPSWSSGPLISMGSGSSAPYRLELNYTFDSQANLANPISPVTNINPEGLTSNWDIRLSQGGSGMQAMGDGPASAMAGSVAAFLAMQDAFSTNAPRVQQDVTAALVADWWRRQLAGNTVTVSQGASARQFTRRADGAWTPPNGNWAVLTQTGDRVRRRYACQGQFSTSREWDPSGQSFSLRNSDGSVMTFSPYDQAFLQNTGTDCARDRGLRLTRWQWPQGPFLTFDHADAGQITAVHSSLGRTLDTSNNFMYPGSGPAFVNGVRNAAGEYTYFAVQPLAAATPTSRPVVRPLLSDVSSAFRPTDGLPLRAGLHYTRDGTSRVSFAYDAEALQRGTRAPHQFIYADGFRGERTDPLGGRFAVSYDDRGRARRFTDELGRITTADYDGLDRVTIRTFPEGDQERFSYDSHNNPIEFRRVAKPGSGLADLVVAADWDSSFNRPTVITDPLLRTTNFTYDPNSGLLLNAQRPPIGGVRPTYSFGYDSNGLVTSETDPTGRVTTYVNDGAGNRSFMTVGAVAVGSSPALNWSRAMPTTQPGTRRW